MTDAMPIAILDAGAADLPDIAGLFRAYARWLIEEQGIDVGTQGFGAELAALPGAYAPPRGVLLVARGPQGAALGCGAFRPLEGATCEMKRLYVVPEARGRGLARRLVAELMERARAAGYGRMVLDTGAAMLPAQRLYESVGFRTIPKYYDSALRDIRYMGAAL